MSGTPQVSGRMREDWDRRAREDACYYVSFGRRKQTRDEFFASAADVLRALREEFRRFPPGADLRNLTALEIGCGPGRLMVPLSHDFGRVWGVDVSGEMLTLARENLASIPHAEVRQSSGADLAGFPAESADFCYSYAVFQHIPDKAIVRSYLREAWCVLKPGGVLKCQFNGLPDGEPAPEPVPGWSLRAGVEPDAGRPAEAPDTWSGVSFRAEEIAPFLASLGFQVLAMDGFDTQYLWVTARKPAPSSGAAPRHARIVRVTNTFTADAVVPRAGRFASASLWVLGLDPAADLLRLRLEAGGRRAAPSFVGKHVWKGPWQVNFYLPPGVRGGLVPVRLLLDGRPVSGDAPMRVIPPGPLVPRLIRVGDGVNLLSSFSVHSRTIKVDLEESPYAAAREVRERFRAWMGGREVHEIEVFRVDPLPRRFEFNLAVPEDLPAGRHPLDIQLGARRFPTVTIELGEPGD